MKIGNISDRMDSWLTRMFLKYVSVRRKEIDRKGPLLAERVQQLQVESWPLVVDVKLGAYRTNFAFTNILRVPSSTDISLIADCAPRYFYFNSNCALKIPNVNDTNILYVYWFLCIGCYGSVFAGATVFYFMNSAAYFDGVYGDFRVNAFLYFFDAAFLFLCFLDPVAVSKIIPVPYIIFDNDIKSVVLRGQGTDEVIPFNRVTFNILQIEDSPAYCALEMHIAYPDKPTQKMITDICESQPQAQSILKTYLAMLSGDEAIYHRKLKRHPALFSEFNMPWWKGILHFWRTTTDWYSCVFTHYIAFRWVHGHPMGVLKKYIIERELKI
ncbi:MAG: hypothetical protein ACHQAX_01530 [Gammaproteobacteria bacterium]